MNFPHSQSSITTEGQQRSRVELANEASDARRQEQIERALARHTQPRMITTINPASEQELSRARNERLQRHGNDGSSFRSQIAAIDEERTSIRIALDSARRSADEALREGRKQDVKKLRARIEDLNIEIDRMAVLEEEAYVGLAHAEREATARKVALEASVPEAEATLKAFVKIQAEYTRLGRPDRRDHRIGGSCRGRLQNAAPGVAGLRGPRDACAVPDCPGRAGATEQHSAAGISPTAGAAAVTE